MTAAGRTVKLFMVRLVTTVMVVAATVKGLTARWGLSFCVTLIPLPRHRAKP